MEQEEWDKYPDVQIAEKKKKRRKTILLLLLIIVIAVLLAVVTYFFGAWKLLTKIFPGSKLNYQQTSKLVTPDKLKGENSGDINVILLGMRGENQKHPKLTNGIMIINYDVKSKKVNLISLPRDFWIPTDKYGYRKISSVCDTPDYDKDPTSCFATAKDTIKKTLGLEINYSFLADFDGFIQIIDDTNSKIDVDVGEHYKDWPFLKEANFVLAKDTTNPSLYHLDGAQSLIFVRWPEDALPDFDRLYRQQLFINVVQDQFFSNKILFNPQKITSILQISSDHVVTDMQLWEGKRLAEYLGAVSSDQISKYSLTSVQNSDGGLLTETDFARAQTLSPRKGNYDFSEITSWATAIIAK